MTIAWQAGHALYAGQVGHQRFIPKPHRLEYDIFYLWLDLQQPMPQFGHLLRAEQFAAFSYRRRDYLRQRPEADLAQAARAQIRSLGGDVEDTDEVYLLTPMANWGLYFSPLSQFYLVRDGQPRYLLAEVSNTPWREQHHYLVPLSGRQSQFQHQKAFHVSPFHPLSMDYHWQISAPSTDFSLSICNYKAGEKHFSAWFSLQRQELNAKTLKDRLIASPWQNVSVILRIYWQALRLVAKRLPIYGHPNSKETSR